MSFVRRKTINGKEYFYLVENRREAGKVRQKTLAFMGECDTVEGAIDNLERRLENNKNWLVKFQKSTSRFREGLHPAFLARFGGKIPRASKQNSMAGNLKRRLGKYWRQVEDIPILERRIESIENRLEILREHA